MAERETVADVSEQPRIAGRPQGRQQPSHAAARDERQFRHRERRPEDRRHPQHVQRVLRQPAQPAQDGQSQRRRQRRHSGLGPPTGHVEDTILPKRAHQLDQEQGVPARAGHLLTQDRPHRDTGNLGGEVSRLLWTQWPEHDVLGATRQQVGDTRDRRSTREIPGVPCRTPPAASRSAVARRTGAPEGSADPPSEDHPPPAPPDPSTQERPAARVPPRPSAIHRQRHRQPASTIRSPLRRPRPTAPARRPTSRMWPAPTPAPPSAAATADLARVHRTRCEAHETRGPRRRSAPHPTDETCRFRPHPR